MSTPQTPPKDRQAGTRSPRAPARGLRDGVRRAAGSLLDAPTRPEAGSRDRRYRRLLAYADALAAGLALVLSIAVLGADRLEPTAVVAIPIVVLVSKLIGLYDRDAVLLRKTTLDESPALFQLATLWTLLAFLLGPLLVHGQLDRDQVAGLWFFLFAFGLLFRAAARQLALRLVPVERCLVVGAPDASQRIARRLEDGHGMKAEMVAWVPLDRGHDLAGSMRDIEEAIARHDVERVVLAPQMTDSEAMLDVIRLVKGAGVKVSILPRLFEVVGSSVEFDDLNGVTVLGVRHFGLTRSSWAVKRSMDLAGATIGLLLAGPLMLAIALAIRLESRGPVLFRQIRVGRDGHRFEIRKFRTMVEGADGMKAALRQRNEAHGLFKIADDPRVTRVGRVLRRTSLDELPQLLNVLRGEMSLVGPRPLVVDEDSKVEGWHRRRLHLTPGMTGHWQILGSSRIPLHEMVKIDYLYVANWSFWGDVKILLRTFPYMLRRGGM
jgi:exopolysaccharide biosynthesis polyprenyl glycosylphosphotransferase